MRSCEDERLCQEARVHYYDLLCQEEAAVPALVRRHVATCLLCQDQMRRLRETLFEAERPASATGAWQDETVEALAQQFQLLDERVTCSEAKPLLPELALESPQIRIPTPVTVHVDHCPQCAGDLATIRELHLSADQLKRLGRLLNGERGAAQRHVEGVPPSKRGLEGDPNRDSSRLGTQARAAAAPGSLSSADADIACDDIVMADLFDCVVPSETVPPGRRTARERQTAIARHVRSCPACLGKMRMLQRTLGAIVARADSEVVTVYHADNDVAELESAYPYPVRVQVLHNDSEAAGDARKVRTALAIGLRKLERSAKPLAALVLIGVALIMLLRTTTPTASGTNLGDVDKTLAKMKNVHIVTREWPAGVAQESWIARPSNILVRKTGDNCVLYDLARDLRRTLNLRTGVRTSERLSPNDPGREGARQFMASCLRDLVAEVSSDASLRPAEGERASGADKGLDVYEVRLPQTRNSPPPSRRLVYIDRATGRPQRMESYRPVPGADPEDATTIMIFEYPTGPEMDEILQTLFPAE
jgi:hypothetical protein